MRLLPLPAPWSRALALAGARFAIAVLLLVGAGAGAGLRAAPDQGEAAAATSWPALFERTLELAQDDPSAALQWLTQAPQDEAPRLRAWRALSAARVHSMLEDEPASSAALAQGARWLAQTSPNDQGLRLMLQLQALMTSFDSVPIAELHARLAGLRLEVQAQAQAQAQALACELEGVAMFLLLEAGSFDEAWRSAEAVEGCAVASGRSGLLSGALASMGRMALAVGGDAAAEPALALFERADVALQGRPARFARSLVAFDAGSALGRVGRHDMALEQLRRALQLSRELRDLAGVAAAQISIVAVLHAQQRHAEMLEPLGEAAQALEGSVSVHRVAHVAELRLLALAALHRSDDPAAAALAPARAVQQALAAVKAVDRHHLLPDARAGLWRARAQAHAALGEHRQAYLALEQAQALSESSRALSRDSQLLSLQARYDGARREAENAELRHREEAARLALQVQSARQRLLWAALVGLGLLVALTGALWWRALERRRTMAALAMRDELTGAPNRRAVAAYAQRCLRQRGAAPVLALIDLDHFKRVNDMHGHAVGDALLRALVAAAGLELRAQDRMGRWGGEEWLLVLPDASAEDVPKVFERLRRRFAQQQVAGLPQPHGVTFSMGAALPVGGSWTLEQALETADQALYRAKAAGRDGLAMGEGLAPAGGPLPPRAPDLATDAVPAAQTQAAAQPAPERTMA